ncbi:hypothetical protein [Rhodococcus sp. Leaf278]|uniref:hypothetical protein n=1 Tax=Rhodococcus sp. Leaf278 TaxID=1736319 RepID=UPI0012E3885F|nr:hypothetical protein [Rhodococcus sp. Leaf278]
MAYIFDMFWTTQQGPRYGFDLRAPDVERWTRCIVEVVCPECDNIVGRAFDGVDGVDLYCWNSADSPSDPDSRSVGWALFTRITSSHPEDDADSGPMPCWRGHGGLHFDAHSCRSAIEALLSSDVQDDLTCEIPNVRYVGREVHDKR